MIGVFNSIDDRVPRNAGSFRRGRGPAARELLSSASPSIRRAARWRRPSSPSGSRGIVQRAIAELARRLRAWPRPGPSARRRSPASSGRDPRHGDAPFVNLIILGIPGGAGHPHGDGWLTNGEIGDGGSMMRDSVEVLELLRPIRVLGRPDRARHARAPAASAARLRCYIEYGPVDTELEVAVRRRRHGQPGARRARRAVRRAVPPSACARPTARSIELRRLGARGAAAGRDDRLDLLRRRRLRAAARARRRARAARRRRGLDQRRARAREVYGVVLAADGDVDEEATRTRRARLAASAEESPGPGPDSVAPVGDGTAAGDPVLRLVELGAPTGSRPRSN